jgi:carboxypeptidase T
VGITDRSFHAGLRAIPAMVAAALLIALLLPVAQGALASTPGRMQQLQNYRVDGVTTKEQRTAIQRTGASIEVVAPDHVLVRGYPGQLSRVRALGFSASPIADPLNFPPADSGFHNYKEMSADIAAEVAAHPDLIRRFSIGKSYEGRDILAAEITKDVGNGEQGRPEVLYDGLHHAREHLTVEETLSIMHLFVDGYGSNSRITNLVDSRVIWIIFDVNPDGGEFDIQGGQYHFWRKNRQPNQGSQYIGTDLNRNYAYNWGCCGGSSGDPASETYRGPSPFSAPESSALADFVDSRVIDGTQHITASISFHTYGQLVMWPYGYTFTNVPPDMTKEDHDVFVRLGTTMARQTCVGGDCYTPQQSSDLYITDGTSVDWLYGTHNIFAFTIEMYPVGGAGFYPPDEDIAAQTQRLEKAVMYLATNADCPYEVIGHTC